MLPFSSKSKSGQNAKRYIYLTVIFFQTNTFHRRTVYVLFFILICHLDYPLNPFATRPTYLNRQELERAAVDAGLCDTESLQIILRLNLSSRRAHTCTYVNFQELERVALDAGLGAKESVQRILHLNLSSLRAPQRKMLKGSAIDAGLYAEIAQARSSYFIIATNPRTQTTRTSTAKSLRGPQ